MKTFAEEFGITEEEKEELTKRIAAQYKHFVDTTAEHTVGVALFENIWDEPYLATDKITLRCTHIEVSASISEALEQIRS